MISVDPLGYWWAITRGDGNRHTNPGNHQPGAQRQAGSQRLHLHVHSPRIRTVSSQHEAHVPQDSKQSAINCLCICELSLSETHGYDVSHKRNTMQDWALVSNND